ncbi:replication protein [Vibrio sp. JPW-9-11-11]|uniref:phage/plasmid replication protein, II/X family n=1 Tax=Vibrio sp. JPW-9-11-11 TaxID=1416532 RepID=UPI001C3DA8EE|nr:phage/plasmid replication protein, II/X family [Vibrio sp. JPW-9-11-11]NVD06647.1 replication protein [Vibrio sp. JPW-9-11-11]
MYDFLEIAIPLKAECVTVMGDCGFVDFEKLGRKTGLKIASGSVEFAIDGSDHTITDDLYHPWSRIPSSFTDIACRVFDACPKANQFWAYARIKASPAKVMQGHNVYGSDNLRLCTEYLLSALQEAQPEFFDMLDVGLAEFRRIDSTYSIQCQSEDVLRQTIKALGNISNRYLKPARNSDYETTLYFNKASESTPDAGRAYVLAIYSKLDEISHQLTELKRRAKREKTSRYERVISQLSDFELRSFAANRLRFEGRAKKRFLERVVGTCGVWKVIRHAEQFEHTNNYSFCEWMFKELFKDLLEAVKGEELEIYNDSKIKALLRDMYPMVTPKGNISYAKADRLFRFYMTLCDRGYDEVKAHSSPSTLGRNMRDLMAIGLSKADLQNLSTGERMPLAQILQFDFDNQRPGNYVEPESPLANVDDSSALAVAFGVTSRLAHEYGLAEDPAEKLKSQLGLGDDFDLDPFLGGAEVPVSPRESISLVIWPDGELTLTRHEQRKFKPNPITRHINPKPERDYESLITKH